MTAQLTWFLSPSFFLCELGLTCPLQVMRTLSPVEGYIITVGPHKYHLTQLLSLVTMTTKTHLKPIMLKLIIEFKTAGGMQLTNDQIWFKKPSGLLTRKHSSGHLKTSLRRIYGIPIDRKPDCFQDTECLHHNTLTHELEHANDVLIYNNKILLKDIHYMQMLYSFSKWKKSLLRRQGELTNLCPKRINSFNLFFLLSHISVAPTRLNLQHFWAQ